jgi:hypothetical protein
VLAAARSKLKSGRMKTTSKVALALMASGAVITGLTGGCADKEPPPPPPHVAVIGFVPDYCFWDGYEYVGWYGDQYYYWGPGRVWLICDPVRVQRVTVFINAHPDWSKRARPNLQYPVDASGHPQPLRMPPPPPPPSTPSQLLPPPARHDHDRDHD